MKPFLLLLLLLPAGCTSSRVSSRPALSNSEETALFRTVLRHFIEAKHEQFGSDSLLVDPRPLRPDPAISDVEARYLADGEEVQVAQRRQVLNDLNIGQIDALKHRHCGEYHGLSVPPLPGETAPPKIPDPLCERMAGDGVLIMGLSRPGGPQYTDPGYTGFDEVSPGLELGHRTVRVLHFTTYSQAVYDVVVHRATDGWHVVDRRMIWWMAS